MKCCGKEVSTPFCPMCGDKIHYHGIDSLLKHCKDALAGHRGSLKSRKASLHYAVTHPESDNARWINRYRSDAKKMEAIVAKWEAWVSCMKEIMSQTED